MYICTFALVVMKNFVERDNLFLATVTSETLSSPGIILIVLVDAFFLTGLTFYQPRQGERAVIITG